MSDIEIRTDVQAPDDTLAGQPLDLHVDDGYIHGTTEIAIQQAIAHPGVKFIGRRFPALYVERKDVSRFRGRQARALRAWASQNMPALEKNLRLGSTLRSDAKTGSDWYWIFVECREPKRAD